MSNKRTRLKEWQVLKTNNVRRINDFANDSPNQVYSDRGRMFDKKYWELHVPFLKWCNLWWTGIYGRHEMTLRQLLQNSLLWCKYYPLWIVTFAGTVLLLLITGSSNSNDSDDAAVTHAMLIVYRVLLPVMNIGQCVLWYFNRDKVSSADVHWTPVQCRASNRWFIGSSFLWIPFAVCWAVSGVQSDKSPSLIGSVFMGVLEMYLANEAYLLAQIFAQWFAADGTRWGSETLINTTTGGVQHSPAVAMARRTVLEQFAEYL